jgi:hypothetical protein
MVVAGLGVVAIGVLAFIAQGGTGRSGTPGQEMRAWVANTGFAQALGTVVGDAARVRIAVDARKGAGVLHTDCGVLLTDAQSANGDLPTPNATVTRLLSAGYALAYDAGTDCYNSGGTDRSLVARATKERIQAEAKLQQAVNLVDRLTGSTVSTTTTTPPGGGVFG